MSDEIGQQGTGERGVFKFEQQHVEKCTINKEILEREGERGLWAYDRTTKEVIKIKEPPKKVVPAPYVITDEIAPTESMVDDQRRMFTSKRKLFDHYREHGFECTGGERQKPPPPYKPDRDKVVDDLRRAFNDAKYGNVELTEEQREICLREEREYQAYKRRRKAAGY